MDSSVLVTVPSGDWVTVFSVDLTVPSLETLLLLVLETSRSHPTSRNDNAKADVATHITAIRFIIICFIGDTSKLRACHDAPRWPAAHNQREAATVENPTSAPPATISEAMRIKRRKARGESAQVFWSPIWPSASLQSAWCGGGGSASCNACPSFTGRQR